MICTRKTKLKKKNFVYVLRKMEFKSWLQWFDKPMRKVYTKNGHIIQKNGVLGFLEKMTSEINLEDLGEGS